MSEFIDNIASVRRAAAEDIQSSSKVQTIGFLATTAMLAAHEIGMEQALFAVGSHALEWTHNPLVVAASMGSFSLAVETGLSFGIAHSIQTFRNATEQIKDNYFITEVKEPDHKDSKVMKAFDNVLLAAALGSPGVVLREYGRNPNKTLEENKRTGYRAARALAAVNVALGLTLAGGAVASEKLGSDAISNAIITAGNSPYFYGGMFGLILTRATFAGRKHRKRKLAAKASSEQAPEQNSD